MTSEDIRNKQWSKEEREALRRHAARQAAGDDSDINFDDIPRLTDEQLAQMVRLRDIRWWCSTAPKWRRPAKQPHGRRRW